ncbi:MAG: hypothetical protein KGR26_05085 [Cyanobacteria bacterium REEB65]|nr:hypothetical protein [Cyanobacteria bacterium REEB65]
MRRVFVLAPDWLGSTDWVIPLHNYLNSFDPAGDCLLWLWADVAEITYDEISAVLGPVLEPFGEERFPELYVAGRNEVLPEDAAIWNLDDAVSDLKTLRCEVLQGL